MITEIIEKFMTTSVKQTITLAALAKELDINKSKLHYYVAEGLIKPVQVIGKTMVFNSRVVRKQLNAVDRERAKGKKLKEIKIKVSKMR